MLTIFKLNATIMRHNFKNLSIWQRSRKLVKEVYLITKTFPKDEKFGLISQMNRSVISIPSNIAEGCGRTTNPQLVYFLDNAIASNCELETQFYLSFDLNYLTKDTLDKLVNELSEIRRMTIAFSNKYR